MILQHVSNCNLHAFRNNCFTNGVERFTVNLQIALESIASSFTAVRCFDSCYVGKQPVAWKEYCVENWLKEFRESMDRCTGRHDITEIL